MKQLADFLRLLAFSLYLLTIVCGAVVTFVVLNDKLSSTFLALMASASIVAVPSLLYIFLPALIGKKDN